MKNESYVRAPLIIALALLVGIVGFIWKSGGMGVYRSNGSTSSAPNGTSASEPSAKAEDNTEPAASTVKSDDKGSNSGNNSNSDNSSNNRSDEMLAVWVPYMSLSVADDPGEENFKKKFDGIVEASKKHGINALIVHVRPCGDSMFLSDYFPYSHILTGVQGEDPGYDAMKYMVDKTHESGLEFHAWINPLRIKVSETPPELSDYSPYSIWQNDADESNDRYTMEYDGGIYLNPAYPEVREYIIGSIKEIVSRYDVDGIHFDDYFYTDSGEDYDREEYESYLSEHDGEPDDSVMSQLEWRTANINSLISGVYSAIKAENSDVVFGISPQGNIENDLAMGADVYSWGSVEGYCDYLCPQNYFNNENSVLPYNKAVDDWRELVTSDKVKLYIGLGLYKAGSDEDDGTWLERDDNIKTQFEYGRSKNVDGFMLYSFDYLENEQSAKEMEKLMKYLNS